MSEEDKKVVEISDKEDELSWDSKRIAKITADLHKMSVDELKDNDQVYEILSDSKADLGITHDFLFYTALVGLFPPSRNILKNWSANQEVFVKLVKDEGLSGRDHFMQSLCLYFIKKYNSEMSKFAPTFMKKLVDENIMSDKFLIQWYDKEIKLDKDSGLYDKKSERKFRELNEQFIEWLRNAESDSGSESSSSEEEEKKEEDDDKEEQKDDEPVVETEAQKKQREMIEKQKKAQAEAFA